MRPSRSPFGTLPALVAVLLLFAPRAGSADKIPVTTSSKEALELFLEGRTLVDNLRLTDAIPYFEKAIAKDAGFAQAHLYLALSAPTTNVFFAELSKADETSARASKGEQLYIKGFKAGSYADPAGQLKMYQELADAYPGDERAQTLVGTAYFGQQDYAQAAEHLKQAVETSPDYAPAYNMLGYSYRSLYKFDDAAATFKKYTELLPGDPNPFDSYGELLLKMGRFDESITQYEKALAVNPKFSNSFAGIASGLMYQNKHAEAVAELQKALDNARNDGETRFALFSRAVVYQDEGKPDKALQEVEKERAIAEKTNDAGSMSGDYALMGNILLQQGKADEALAKFTSSFSVVQKSSLAKEVKENNELFHHYNIARALLAKGDIAGAKSEAGKFRKGTEGKGNKNQARLAHELAGFIAFHQKEYAAAVDELKQANQQDPRILYQLALASQETGKTEDAKNYATWAAKFNSLPFMNYAYVRMKAEKLLSAL